MSDMPEFEREYFIQTRKEIDTEKQERDHILNFAIIILGALGFAVIQSDQAKEFLKQPYSIILEASTLIILTSLFWIRRKKLQQIADRWYTLYRLSIRYLGSKHTDESMEAIVIKGFEKARYLRKDAVLNLALSLPIYTLIFISSIGLSAHIAYRVLTSTIIIIFHILLSFILLTIKMKDPFSKPIIDDKNKASHNNINPPSEHKYEK